MSDLRQVVRNTALTGITYLVTALVGLLLVPVLVGAYGIAAFGLLLIARTLLPNGVFALMDFGVGESAMLAVAQARSRGEWRVASEQLTLLLVISLASGALVAAALFSLAPALVSVFAVDSVVALPFVEMVQVTAVSLALLFPALIIEGLTKGFERFDLLRACEALATVAYGVFAAALAWAEKPFETIQYAFLAAGAAKYAALAAGITGDARRAGIRLVAWSRDTVRHVRLRSMLLLQAKLLGALQASAPQLLVGAFVGPEGVGLYDIITRLPRALKPVLSILASVIAPTAARLQGAGEAARLREIGKTGIWLVPFVVLPPLSAMFVHADFILVAWISPEYERYGSWLAVALVVPTLFIALQFGQNALQADAEFLKKTNRLAAVAVTVQFILSFGLVHWLDERAFVLGQAIGVAAVFPANVRLLAARFGLAARWVFTQLLGIVAPALALAPLALVVLRYMEAPTSMARVGAFFVWCGIYWSAGYWVILQEDQRALLRRLFAVLSVGRSK